jgi:hypothetical protein
MRTRSPLRNSLTFDIQKERENSGISPEKKNEARSVQIPFTPFFSCPTSGLEMFSLLGSSSGGDHRYPVTFSSRTVVAEVEGKETRGYGHVGFYLSPSWRLSLRRPAVPPAPFWPSEAWTGSWRTPRIVAASMLAYLLPEHDVWSFTGGRGKTGCATSGFGTPLHGVSTTGLVLLHHHRLLGELPRRDIGKRSGPGRVLRVIALLDTPFCYMLGGTMKRS